MILTSKPYMLRQQNNPTNKSGVNHFYSLSTYSSGVGTSGDNPFLFLMSAITLVKIEFGTGVHALKWVFHMARPAVWPLIISDKSNVSDAGSSPDIICMTPFC